MQSLRNLKKKINLLQSNAGKQTAKATNSEQNITRPINPDVKINVILLFFYLNHLLFQQAPAQSWTHPSMEGNSAGHTVWATRFTSCATRAMNWWDQRAGFVRRAWPGVASSRPAEVRDRYWSSAIRGLHRLLVILFPPKPLLFLTLTISHPVILPTDHSYNPCHQPLPLLLSIAIPLFVHHAWKQLCRDIVYIWPRSYFLSMSFGHCPESVLKAETCDSPASVSSYSLPTLR